MERNRDGGPRKRQAGRAAGAQFVGRAAVEAAPQERVTPPNAPRRRVVVLGGSLHHRGGLEAYCERAATAIDRHAAAWEAEWWPADTAYFSLRRTGALITAARRVVALGPDDLVWLQWSTLLDLLLLRLAKAQGAAVLVTPHLGAASRLQRSPMLRGLCVRLLAAADRLALLFDGQDREIALPVAVPRSTIGTFLPQETLAAPLPSWQGGILRLIHAGRLSAEKGTFRMVALCALLRERGVAFSGRIVGRADPETMAALSAAIEAAGIADALTLSGWLDGAALRDALGEADVLVHLSELDSFPLIVLEALAAGAIPIVADMAGASAMVRRYDGLVTTGSDSVAAAGEWLAGCDPADLRRRGRSAAAQVRDDHRWATIVARLETILAATRSQPTG